MGDDNVFRCAVDPEDLGSLTAHVPPMRWRDEGGGRRMADTAAYLCDSVLPEVPYRQWVFTVPFRIRCPLTFDREVCARVKKIFVRAVMSFLRLADLLFDRSSQTGV